LENLKGQPNTKNAYFQKMQFKVSNAWKRDFKLEDLTSGCRSLSVAVRRSKVAMLKLPISLTTLLFYCLERDLEQNTPKHNLINKSE